METTNFSKLITVPVALKGGSNYLMWSQLVRTTIGRLGLWNHITDDGPEPVAKEDEEEGDGKTLAVAEAKRWVQEDLMVLSVLHASLELPILEAYVHFETPKRLWDMLHKRYGNKSNISRVFDLKQTISALKQDGEDLTKHMGKFGALWSELESLRPNTTDEESLIERREQDQVFGLLMTLDESYQDVIKHILRSPTLPSMEEVCAQLQKEEGSLGLFGGKKGMSTAHKAEEAQANKAAYRGDGRKYEKYEGSCEHCKRQGHKKSQCWILHPHLRPSKFNKDREAKAHLSAEASGAGSSGASPNVKAGESEGRALTSQEVITKADFEAFIRALKESGKMLGNTLGYSYSAHTLPSISDKLLDIFKTSCTATAHTKISDRLLGVVKSLKAENETSRINTARSLHKPLIIDSGASHHMISDNNLIKDIEPAHGHVMIANGDRIPIRGIGKLNLFNKDSKAFYMPEFTSNLLSVKKCTT
ncbi:BnaUnng05000D, partial [Brassica napus]